MLRILVPAALALALLAGSALAAPVPKTVVFDAKAGKVTFTHDAHQKLASGCKACHPGAPAKLGGKEAAHALCQGCHKERKAGPSKCGDCHVKG